MSGSKSTLIIVGALLVILGIAGLAVPYFTTQQTKDVASIGSLKVQTQQSTPHEIPPLVSGGAIVVGVVVMGAGLFRTA